MEKNGVYSQNNQQKLKAADNFKDFFPHFSGWGRTVQF